MSSGSVPVVTSDTIQSLQGECHRASKRHKSTSAALHQQVDNLIELVKSFLAQHQEQEQENASPEAGKLFMRVQLPQFASELKKLMKKVSTAYRELQSQSIAPMGKSIDRSFVQNQEAFLDHYMETNGFSATINTTTTTGSTTGTASDTTALFDEDALKLVVMQHLVREGHFEVVNILEEEMTPSSSSHATDADGDQMMQDEQSPSTHEPVRVSDSYKKVFREMYDILDDMKHRRQLRKALEWCRCRIERLKQQSGSRAADVVVSGGDLLGNASTASKLLRLHTLEFMLHKLQFIELLRIASNEEECEQKRSESLREAITYSRMHLSRFSEHHMEEIRFLMGSLLYAKKLRDSPYKNLLENSHWDRAIEVFKMECCAQEGQPMQSPLYVTLTAGAQALPTMLKMLNVTKNKLSQSVPSISQEEMIESDSDYDSDDEEFIFGDHDPSSMRRRKHPKRRQVGELGVNVDLDPSFTFHSVFTCPVSKEMANDDNPPMMLPCGHVLAKNSITKMIRPPRTSFKCPYCPTEASMSTCKKICF